MTLNDVTVFEWDRVARLGRRRRGVCAVTPVQYEQIVSDVASVVVWTLQPGNDARNDLTKSSQILGEARGYAAAGASALKEEETRNRRATLAESSGPVPVSEVGPCLQLLR